MRVAGAQSDRDALAPMADRWTNAIVPNITEFEEIENEGGEVITPARQHAEAVQTAAEGVDIAVDGEGGVAFGYKLGRRKADAMSRSLDRFTK